MPSLDSLFIVFTRDSEMYISGSTVTLKNNILRGLGDGNGYGVVIADSSTVADDCDADGISDNAISGYSSRYAFGGTASSRKAWTADPLFVALTDDSNSCNEDLHLSASSPYLEMGGGSTAGGCADLDPDGSPAQFGMYGGPGGTWPTSLSACSGKQRFRFGLLPKKTPPPRYQPHSRDKLIVKGMTRMTAIKC